MMKIVTMETIASAFCANRL